MTTKIKLNNQVNSEESPAYSFDTVRRANDLQKEERAIKKALAILASRLKSDGIPYQNPRDVKRFLIMQLAENFDEKFSVMFLDSQHRLIEYKTLFTGTVDGASIYPRVLVREALFCNARAVVLSHNHPSGLATPSQADITLTQRLKTALELVDVRILDHIIIGGSDNLNTYSMAEQGDI